MPTLRGLRRRGYPASAIREFCAFIGVARTNSRHQIELLESFVRNELNRTAQRRMAVLRPLRMVVTDWPTDGDGKPVVEHFDVLNNPENEADGMRSVAFSGELFIERDDFMLDPPPKFFRLSPGREVRLRGAYLVTCTHADVDADGNVTTVYVTHDPASRGRHGARRSQGEVDDALGVGDARRAGHGRPVRAAVHGRGAGCRRPTIRSTTSTATRGS